MAAELNNALKLIEQSNNGRVDPDVLELVDYIINSLIYSSASIGENYVNVTDHIPAYGCLQRRRWFKALKIIEEKGFAVCNQYLGKAYAINGNIYGTIIKWEANE